MTEDIVARGMELMLYGMGTVLLFLALLIVATVVMSACVQRFFPEVVAVSPPVADATRDHRVEDPQVVAVISAAVQRYRSQRR